MSGCTGASKFLQLEEFCGTSGLLNVTWTNNDTASENKPTQICRRSGRSVSHLLVCRIPFLCRCVYSCLSRSDEDMEELTIPTLPQKPAPSSLSFDTSPRKAPSSAFNAFGSPCKRARHM